MKAREDMKTFVVTGSCSGLGQAIARKLESNGHRVIDYDLSLGQDVRNPDVGFIRGPVHGLVNCAGVNLIDWFQQLPESTWDLVVDTNVKGIYLMTQALMGKLAATKGVVLNIVSNASHMPMTCSAAYNASKGAAAILTKQLARELTRAHGITVFAISPNKLAGTHMSAMIESQVCQARGWTREEANKYQLDSLLWREETPVENVAEFAAWLLDKPHRSKFLSGCDIPYGS